MLLLLDEGRSTFWRRRERTRSDSRRRQQAREGDDKRRQVSRDLLVRLVDDEEPDIVNGEKSHREQLEEALRRANDDVRGSAEEVGRVRGEVALVVHAEGDANSERTSEGDGETLSLSGCRFMESQ